MANSRMKDFFDVVSLQEFEFERQQLAAAIRGTFERRQTPVPTGLRLALTAPFAREPTKQKPVVSAFLARSQVIDAAHSLPELVAGIASFMAPAIEAATGGKSNPGLKPGGPWG